MSTSIIKDFIVKQGLVVQGTSGTVSASSGALQVGGGAGLGGSVFVAGTGTFGATTPGAGSSSTIAQQTLQVKNGGFGVVGDSYLNGNFNISGQQYINNPANAGSTGTGALTILGGVGIGANLYIGGTAYASGGQILTTATLGLYGVSALFAGTDTAVSANTGSVTVWSTSTLQSITNRGANTNNALIFQNSTNSSNTNSGALIVYGGVGVWNNLNVGGTISGSSNLSVATTASFGSTTDATALNAAAVTLAGGLGVAKTIWTQAEVVTGTGASASVTATNALAITNGGLGVAKDSIFGANVNIVGAATSVNTNSGQALLIAGGVGVGTQLAAGKVLTTDQTPAATNGSGSLQVQGGAYIANNIVVAGTQQSTSTTASNALYVAGGVGIGGSMYVGGPVTFSSPVTFNGTATYVLSTNSYYTDNLLEIHVPPGGVGGQWASDDGKDIGLRFHYYNRTASTDSNAALVLADDSQLLEWYGSGAETNTGTFSGSGLASYGGFKLGFVQLMSGTNATSAITGAVRVQNGGIGAAGNIWLGGTGATASSSTYSAQTIITNAGGLGVNGDSFFNNNLGIGGNQWINNALSVGTIAQINGGTGSTSSLTTQGLQITSGGLAVTGASNINGALSISGVTYHTNSTNATPNGNASVVLTGGQFITQDLRVQGTMYGSLWGTASTATNITGGVAGSIPIQAGVGSTSFISMSAGQAGYLLQVQSGGTTATWQSISAIVGAGVPANQLAITGTNAAVPYYPAIVSNVYPVGSIFENVYSTSTMSIIPSTGQTQFYGTVTSNSTLTGTVIVGGGIGAGGNVNVGGSGQFFGAYNETSTNIAVNVGVAGSGTPSPRVGFFNGTAAQNWQIDNFNGNFRWFTPNVTRMQLDPSGNLYIYTGTNATNTFSGALQVAGGVGIGNQLYVGGVTNLQNSANAISTTSAALIVAGGAGIGNALFVGSTATIGGAGDFVIQPSTGSGPTVFSSFATANLFTQGSTTLVNVGQATTNAKFNSTLAASNTSTAGLVVTGGVGIGANLLVGSTLGVLSGNNATSTSTGALTVAGGVGIANQLYVGGIVTGATGTAGTSVVGFVTNNVTIATYTGSALNAASTGTTQNLDVWSTSSYRSARYSVQLVDTGYTPHRVHFTEIVLIHDGTNNVYKNEYGVMTNVGELGTFDAAVVAGGVQLTFQPAWPTLSPPSALVVKATRTTFNY